MILFSGPCAIESYDICLEVATEMERICHSLGIEYVFKASFDKANRTSGKSFRGAENSLKIKCLETEFDSISVDTPEDILKLPKE